MEKFIVMLSGFYGVGRERGNNRGRERGVYVGLRGREDRGLRKINLG